MPFFFFFNHSQYTLREDVIFGNRPKKFGLKFGEYICWICWINLTKKKDYCVVSLIIVYLALRNTKSRYGG